MVRKGLQKNSMHNQDVVKPDKVYVEKLLEGYGQAGAAKLAGLTDVNATRAMRGAISSGQLRGYARELMRGKIELEGAPAGYRVLMAILHDDRATLPLKADVAKYLINHSVPAPKAAEETSTREKDPSEMTNEELQAFIRQVDAELIQRGHLIDATPVQVIDDII